MIDPAYKDNPFLLFMQSKIEELLHNIEVYSMDPSQSERIFITIDGVGGCGKTNFVYEYLQGFLFGESVIKKYQEKIDKIGMRDLFTTHLKDRSIDEIINEKFKNCKDGILIIDEFTERDKNARAVADIIKRIHTSSEYKNTTVILMGEYNNNTAFIKKFRLENLFNRKFRLSFFTPSFRQISEVFETYARKKGDYTITDKARNTLVFYFSKTKAVKDAKAKLSKLGQIKCTADEKKFGYTSEMFQIYKDIDHYKSTKDHYNKSIDQFDIFNAICYKRLLEDMKQFEQDLEGPTKH